MSKDFTASNGLLVRPHKLDVGAFVVDGTYVNSDQVVALREFFEWEASHKPWDDAKAGEIWALTVDGVESAWDRADGIWFKNQSLTEAAPESITAGRRIWPEEQ